MKIGIIIKQIRQDRKLTQIEFSHMANIDYSTLRKVETGKVKNPSVIFCVKIAIALNIPITEIIKIEHFLKKP